MQTIHFGKSITLRLLIVRMYEAGEDDGKSEVTEYRWWTLLPYITVGKYNSYFIVMIGWLCYRIAFTYNQK